MKILMFAIREKGGVGRYCHEVKEELAKQDHRIRIYYREDESKIYSAFKWLTHRIDTSLYDIIYTQDWSMALPFLLKKNHYCCFHGFNPSLLGKILQKFVGLCMGKRLIVVSDKLKQAFKESHRNYEGVNLERFRPINIKRDCIGMIQTPYPQYSYEKAGHLKYKKELTEEGLYLLGERCGLKLLIAKKIKPENMVGFYNRCKMFINLPPSYAGFNLCWLEAMASGVPMIIGNENGVGAELPITRIEDFEGDVYDALEHSLHNPKNQREWLIKNNWTWKKHTDKLIEVFKR